MFAFMDRINSLFFQLFPRKFLKLKFCYSDYLVESLAMIAMCYMFLNELIKMSLLQVNLNFIILSVRKLISMISNSLENWYM